MHIALKIVLLQSFWFFAVLVGPKGYGLLVYLVAAGFTTLNYLLTKPSISVVKYVSLAIIFALCGVIQDQGLYLLDWIEYPDSSFPLWLNSLWIVFLCYYNDVFVRFRALHPAYLALIGACGGALAYWGGVNLSGSSIAVGKEMYYLAAVAGFWGIFFPTSMHFYYRKL